MSVVCDVSGEFVLSVDASVNHLVLALGRGVRVGTLRKWINRHLLSCGRPKHRFAAQALVAVETALLSPDLAYTAEMSKHHGGWLKWLSQDTGSVFHQERYRALSTKEDT